MAPDQAIHVVGKTSIENEIKKIKEKIKSYNSSAYNCDETALFYRVIPDKSLSTKYESHHGVKRANKDRITILLCCNSTGTNKWKLFIIGKAKKPRSLKNFNALCLRIVLTFVLCLHIKFESMDVRKHFPRIGLIAWLECSLCCWKQEDITFLR